MQEDNVLFSITLAAPQKLPAADCDSELIELNLIAPSFTVPLERDSYTSQVKTKMVVPV